MKKLNYGLIVSDFDGTLITSNQEILPEVKDAIEEYVGCGGIFAVCTGRMLKSILPKVREIGLKGLVIAYQGTVIAEIESGKIIKSGGLEYSDVVFVCKEMERIGANINVYCGDNMYTNIPADDKYLQIYENITGIYAEHINCKMSEYVEQNKLFCQKITSLVSKENRIKLFSELSNTLSGKFDVTCSASSLVEVSPISDNKGEAVKFLSNHFGVPIDKTVAIGDNLNDLSMIKAAGLGVAVDNAIDELKRYAQVVTVSNNDGAVAKIIKKYGFAKYYV